MDSLELKTNLKLVKDGTDFIDSLTQDATVSAGFMQVVEALTTGASVDLGNLTTIEAIAVRNRDAMTTVHLECTFRWETYSFVANDLAFLNYAPSSDSVTSLTASPGLLSVQPGEYVRISGTSNSGENDGVYLVVHTAPGASTYGELFVPLSQALVARNPEPNAVTMHREVRNRVAIAPGSFCLVSGSQLVAADDLVLRTPVRTADAATCEAWVFGT